MQTRQYVKLFALFFGSYLIVLSLSHLFSVPRSGYSDSIFSNGMWLFPAIAVGMSAFLYLYASKMTLAEDSPMQGLVSGDIRLYGLYLFVTGFIMVVSGLFSLNVLFEQPELLPEVSNAHLLYKPFVIGGLQIFLSILFIFKTHSIVRILGIKGDA